MDQLSSIDASFLHLETPETPKMPTPSKIRPYLPVEDLPQTHQILMTADEQSKIKNELIAARARQEAALKALQQQ
jgi:hypothetical protein